MAYVYSLLSDGRTKVEHALEEIQGENGKIIDVPTATSHDLSHGMTLSLDSWERQYAYQLEGGQT